MAKQIKDAPAFTHVSLRDGRSGFILSEDDDEVVMQDDSGKAQAYDRDRLHFTWARKDWNGHAAQDS